MLYSIFIKKNKGDHSPSFIPKILNNYLNFYGKNDIVIAFPGYMGRTTSTIDNFINNINFPKDTYFSIGMNGQQSINNHPQTIQKYHNSHFSNSNIQNINYYANTDIDHSKMIFFLDNNFNPLNTPIDCKFIKIKALLIGSSNQSYTTYFSNYADKGEADVFFLDESIFGGINSIDNCLIELITNDPTHKENPDKNHNQQKRENLHNNIIISKELPLFGNGNSTLLEILKSKFNKYNLI